MLIALHKQARTTPAIGAEIAASSEPISKLARRDQVTAATLRKWPSRTDFQGRSRASPADDLDPSAGDDCRPFAQDAAVVSG